MQTSHESHASIGGGLFNNRKKFCKQKIPFQIGGEFFCL